MKKAQQKVWGGRHHYPKLQLTLMTFTICPCPVVRELWWFLSSEPLQIKMTRTDTPQTKWDHILCKLCIQQLWFLYLQVTRAVWKSVTLGRKSSSEANLGSHAATWPHKLRVWYFRNSYSTNNFQHPFSRHTKNSNFNLVLKIRISPKDISKTNCALITGNILFPTF